METYLERIKQLKKQKHITTDMLSEMTDIPIGTLSKLLAGIGESPKLSNIVAIANALGCSLDWLVSGKPDNNNNCTLTEEEFSVLDGYRLLDNYGRSLTISVIRQEKERAERQASDRALEWTNRKQTK